MNQVIEAMSRVQANMMDVLFKYTRGELSEEQASEEMDRVIEESRYLATVKEDMDYYYKVVAAG